MMSDTPLYACVRFLDTKNKNYFRSINVIKTSKTVKNHIQPNNMNDYDPKQCYFIYWCDCGNAGDCYGEESCIELDLSNNDKYFKGYIICLGESVKDCTWKMSQKKRRIIFPKRFSSSDSEDDSGRNVTNDHEYKNKVKEIAQTVRQDLSSTTMHNYEQHFMNSRKRKEFSKETLAPSNDNLVNCSSCQTLEMTISELNYKIKDRDIEILNLKSALNDLTGPKKIPDSNLNVRRQLFESPDNKENTSNPDAYVGGDEGSKKIPDSNLNVRRQLFESSDNNENTSNPDAYVGGDEGMSVFSEGGETSNEDLMYIQKYKPKMFKYLKSNGLIAKERIDEAHNRYDVVEGKVYLGLNIKAGQQTWQSVKNKKREKFIREVACIIWKRRDLANRALNLKKVVNKLPNRSPVKMVTPRKYNLLLGLVADFVSEKPSYNHLEEEQKDYIVSNTTEVLSALIRDLKKTESVLSIN